MASGMPSRPHQFQYKGFKKGYLLLLMALDHCIESTYIENGDHLREDDHLASLLGFLNTPRLKQEDLVEEIIQERIRLQKASLAQLISLIKQRERIKQNNLSSIASEIMSVQGQLFIYKCIMYPISPDHKRKGNLERALSELEHRRRQEELNCWQDTLELWQELLKIAAEYKSAKRKMALIMGIDLKANEDSK